MMHPGHPGHSPSRGPPGSRPVSVVPNDESVVPGGTNVIPGYDPATVRAMNLSRAENLMHQKQQFYHPGQAQGHPGGQAHPGQVHGHHGQQHSPASSSSSDMPPMRGATHPHAQHMFQMMQNGSGPPPPQGPPGGGAQAPPQLYRPSPSIPENHHRQQPHQNEPHLRQLPHENQNHQMPRPPENHHVPRVPPQDHVPRPPPPNRQEAPPLPSPHLHQQMPMPPRNMNNQMPPQVFPKPHERLSPRPQYLPEDQVPGKVPQVPQPQGLPQRQREPYMNY